MTSPLQPVTAPSSLEEFISNACFFLWAQSQLKFTASRTSALIIHPSTYCNLFSRAQSLFLCLFVKGLLRDAVRGESKKQSGNGGEEKYEKWESTIELKLAWNNVSKAIVVDGSLFENPIFDFCLLHVSVFLTHLRAHKTTENKRREEKEKKSRSDLPSYSFFDLCC